MLVLIPIHLGPRTLPPSHPLHHARILDMHPDKLSLDQQLALQDPANEFLWSCYRRAWAEIIDSRRIKPRPVPAAAPTPAA